MTCPCTAGGMSAAPLLVTWCGVPNGRATRTGRGSAPGRSRSSKTGTAHSTGFRVFSVQHLPRCCGQRKAGTRIEPSKPRCRHSLDVIIPFRDVILILTHFQAGSLGLLVHRTHSRCSWRRAIDQVMYKHCEWLGAMPSLKRDASRIEAEHAARRVVLLSKGATQNCPAPSSDKTASARHCHVQCVIPMLLQSSSSLLQG